MELHASAPRTITVAELCLAIAEGRIRTTRRAGRYDVRWDDILELANAEAPPAVGTPIIDWGLNYDYLATL